MRTKFPQPNFVGKTIEIIYCWSKSSNYDNLKPGTRHKIIQPSEGFSNTQDRVWVKGSPDPALLLPEEFKFTKRRTK